jgi:hypothetical protein
LADTIYQWELMTDEWGDIIFRPSDGFDQIYDLQVPFKGIAVANNTLFGFGHPEFPNKLYWSEAGEMSIWPVANELSIKEAVNDEIVDVVPVVNRLSEDFLYVIKHHNIFLVSGDFPGYGFDVFQSGTYDYTQIGSVGALSKSAIKEYGDVIYFMSPHLRCYALASTGEPLEISQPIENRIDSIFDTSYTTAYQYCRAVMLDEEVAWFNENTGEAIAFNTTNGLWSVQDYSYSERDEGSFSISPRGSFAYDSSTATEGFGYGSEKIFVADTTLPLFVRNRGNDQVYTPNVSWRAILPVVGDGQKLGSIREFQILMNDSAHICGYGSQSRRLRVWVYNLDGDSLCVDSFVVDKDSPREHNILRAHLPDNFGSWLSFGLGVDSIWGGLGPPSETDSGYCDIYQIKLLVDPSLVEVEIE